MSYLWDAIQMLGGLGQQDQGDPIRRMLGQYPTQARPMGGGEKTLLAAAFTAPLLGQLLNRARPKPGQAGRDWAQGMQQSLGIGAGVLGDIRGRQQGELEQRQARYGADFNIQKYLEDARVQQAEARSKAASDAQARADKEADANFVPGAPVDVGRGLRRAETSRGRYTYERDPAPVQPKGVETIRLPGGGVGYMKTGPDGQPYIEELLSANPDAGAGLQNNADARGQSDQWFQYLKDAALSMKKGMQETEIPAYIAANKQAVEDQASIWWQSAFPGVPPPRETKPTYGATLGEATMNSILGGQ